MESIDKKSQLLALAKLRQQTRYHQYKCIGDYHAEVYECDFVSPYTIAAGNVDATIMVVLQDWASDESLKGPIHEPSARFGHDPALPTNRNLKRLLSTIFDLTLQDIYGTNVFPFVKPGGMSSAIRQKDLIKAAQQFALQEIRIVQPKLVICLGLVTFNALRRAWNLRPCDTLSVAIDQSFDIGDIRVWCQAHTGTLGQNNRNKGGVGRVSADWEKMRAEVGFANSKTETLS